MADTAAHLVDHVLPHAPVRQWVLSCPYRIRFLLASSPRPRTAVRGILTRTRLAWLEQRALRASAPELTARSGAVVFAQRFGSALNLSRHFHALVLDGAFVLPSSSVSPRFQPAAPLTDADVVELVEQLAQRITRYLQRLGRLPRAHAPVEGDESAEHEASFFGQPCAASISGSSALAPESVQPATTANRQPRRR